MTRSDPGIGTCMLSFDVEDWFQVERLRSSSAGQAWEVQELRVQANVERLLEILDGNGTLATFFVLGWIAERAPGLVESIMSRGHEIACHGYGHVLLSQLDEQEFESDLVKSKQILEDRTGVEVVGYRAPRFSTVEYLPRVLRKHGFRYDSSFFPSSIGVEYGSIDVEEAGTAWRFSNGLVEVPISTLSLRGRKLPWGGGGYFRFYPYRVFRAGVRSLVGRNGWYLFYAHPWELDPGQPRVKDVPWLDRLLHYSLLSATEGKLSRLIRDFHFVPIRNGLVQLGLL